MKQLQFPLNVSVNGQGGAYTTQTVAGLRSSCTHSAEQAVIGLCAKIAAQQGLRAEALAVRQVPAKGLGLCKSIWRIERKAG